MSENPIGLLAGLGNPGSRYQNTRHNAGFMAMDALFPRVAWKQQFGADVSKEPGSYGYPLVKPLEYMNLSGQSLGKLARFFKVSPDRVVVVHDEIDLPFGTIQLKRGGGEGGHNGLRSISTHFGTRDYLRLRIGVGRPADARVDVASWVLQRFTSDEMSELEAIFKRVEDAIACLQQSGLSTAQNLYNR